MAQSSPSRRRKWLVNRRLQLPFVAVLFAKVFVLLVLLGVCAYLVNSRLHAVAGDLIKRQETPLLASELAKASRSFVLRIFLFVTLGGVLLVLYGLYASNKLAGPMLRVGRLLAELQAGNTSQRIVFRRGDCLDGLAEALNGRISALDEPQNRLKAEIPFIASSLQSIRAAVDGAQLPLDEAEIRKLEVTLRGLAEAWQLQKPATQKSTS